MFADAPLFRSLASLHRAGVPWPQAMASASGGDDRFDAAEEALADGASLSEAMKPFVEPLDLALLRAGEESGTLESALERIAARHEEEGRLLSARRTALLYPVVMGHVAAGLAPLPDLLRGDYGVALMWMAAILVPLYGFLWLTRPRRIPASRVVHPGTRPPRAAGFRQSAVEEADARALLALADGYDAGLPLDDALELAERAGPGGRVAFDLHRARPRVRDGEPLRSAWIAIGEDMAGELAVAEDAGEIGQTARHIAARLAFQVQMRRKKIASVLPLALLLVVGAVVAWRVFSFYGDMYSKVPGM